MTTRQRLIWLIMVASTTAIFMAWSNYSAMQQTSSSSSIVSNGGSGSTLEGGTTIYKKAFQVNSLNSDKPLENPIRQISLIGERNSGTKWMWA